MTLYTTILNQKSGFLLNFLNRQFLLIILFLFSVNVQGVFAQTEKEENWELLNKKDGIEVYSQIITCETEGFLLPPKYLVFKVTNTNSVVQKVELKFEIHFEEGCNGCGDSNETTLDININAGQTIGSSCQDFKNRLAYLIFNPNFASSSKYVNSNVLIQIIK